MSGILHNYISFFFVAIVFCGCVRSNDINTVAQSNSPLVLSQDGDYRIAREYKGAEDEILGYFYYPPSNPANGTSLIYLHGIESHAGWFDQVARALAAKGYAVYSLDRRGSGINRENRGFQSGDIASYETLLEDIQLFIKAVPRRGQPRILIGLSWGGKLAMGYALTYPHDVDALVLITPGLKSKVDLQMWEKALLVGALAVKPASRFAVPIETSMFTTDPIWQERINQDPLRLHSVTAHFLWENRKLDSLIERHISHNLTPVLLFLAGIDRIVDNEKIISLLGQGRQDILTILRYNDQTHSIQFEASERLASDMDHWIRLSRPRGEWTEEGIAP